MRKIILFLVCILVFSAAAPASADIAPPAEPPGANPIPGNASTNVRMVEETVRIDVQSQTRENTLGQAQVNAEFIMRNPGTSDESMAVRFPLGIPNGWGDIAFIENIDVMIEGKSVPTRRINGADPAGSDEQVPWAEFDVVFPAGSDTRVTVAYSLEAAGETPYIWFNYIFSSGAGWKDTIGKADLIVSFPYEVNELFLLYCIDNLYNCTIPGGVIKENQITWTYTDFEPEAEDNFMIAFVAPSVWQQVLSEQERVAANPNDGEAWGRLGKLYKSLIFSPHGWRGFRNYYYKADPGVEQLFQLSDKAYSQALNLLPKDAQWHAGYAELLGYYTEFAGYEGVDTLALKIKALQELHVALELAPQDEKVREIAYGLTWPLDQGLVENGENFDFPWLTATPVPTAVITQPATPSTLPTSTVTVVPTQPMEIVTTTPMPPVVDPTAVPAAETKKPPICASAFLFPFLMLLGVKLGHNRSRKPNP